MNPIVMSHPANADIRSGGTTKLQSAKAARDFEAGLVDSLLESLERSFIRLDREDTTPGADDYRYLGTQALAATIASKGGFGIASMILEHLPKEDAPVTGAQGKSKPVKQD